MSVFFLMCATVFIIRPSTVVASFLILNPQCQLSSLEEEEVEWHSVFLWIHGARREPDPKRRTVKRMICTHLGVRRSQAQPNSIRRIIFEDGRTRDSITFLVSVLGSVVRSALVEVLGFMWRGGRLIVPHIAAITLAFTVSCFLLET